MPPTPSTCSATSDKDKPPASPAAQSGGALVRLGCSLLLLVAFCRRSGLPRIATRSTYTSFDAQVRAHNVKSLDVYGPVAYGEFVEPPLLQPASDAKPARPEGRRKPTKDRRRAGRRAEQEFLGHAARAKTLTPELVRQWREAGVESIAFHKPKNYSDLLLLVWLGLLMFLVLGGWSMARRARDQMLGGGMLPGVLRSPARRYSTEGPQVTFKDVAGLEREEGPAGDRRVSARPEEVSASSAAACPRACC